MPTYNYKVKVKAGESKNIEFTVMDSRGVPIDLGEKDIFFTIRKKGATENAVELGACTALDQTENKGKAYYPLTTEVSSDFEAGAYYAEVCVVDEFGQSYFCPNDFDTGKDFITIEVSIPLAVPE